MGTLTNIKMFNENFHTFNMESDLVLCRLPKTIARLNNIGVKSKFIVHDTTISGTIITVNPREGLLYNM